MKLTAFTAGSAAEIGVIDGDRVISFSRAAPLLAHNMMELIVGWPEVELEARRIAKTAEHVLKLGEVRLLAPIARPGKIMAIGLNYADHIAESKMATPEHQVWFSKMPTS